jgi:hypothetical protein
MHKGGHEINTTVGRKKTIMAVKYANIFHCKTLKIYPMWHFLFENIPSGNHAFDNTDFALKSDLPGKL